MALALALQLPVVLGGVFNLDQETRDRWPVAAAWRIPVGDPVTLGAPGPDGEPAYTLNRGVEWSHGRATHQGADIADGHAGDPVHAAAGGLVLLVYDGDNGNGYGGHVVVAHRLEDGRTFYTVYAHLLAGSIAVRAGDVVGVGDALGRVGQTGRASTPHLHFEVRAPHDLSDRWEHARVVDPLAFVRRNGVAEASFAETGDADRGADADSALADGATYARWARDQGLLPAAADATRPLTRATWWRMLATAIVGGPDGNRVRPEALRDSLMDSGMLPEEEGDAPADEHLGWAELARDLKRLNAAGVRIPHGPLPAERHAGVCERRFGQREPGEHASSLKRRPGEPGVIDACIVIADVSGPLPPPAYGRAERHGKRAHVQRAAHHPPHRRRHPRRLAPAARAPGAKTPR